ncbi:MAG: hypothetical protein AB8G14_13870 [Ilumatobacter sp.]
MTVDESSPGAGETITVTANCSGTETVTFTLNGAAASTACADGTATTTVSVPNTPGPFVLGATGEDSGDLGSTEIEVVAAAAPAAPTGGLPATGSDGVGLTAMVAGGLLAVGLLLFGTATLRRRQAPAA